MTLEDAKYYSFMILLGEYSEFDKIMQGLILSDCELDELTSDLLFAGNDRNRYFDILNKYHIGKEVKDEEVAFRIIKFIKQNLRVGKIDRVKAIDMFRAIANSEFSKTENKREPWITMSLLRYAQDGDNSIIYSSDFDNFIEKGITLTKDKEFEEKFKKLFG